MRVLLDENLPQKLRFTLTGHQVVTVNYKGWGGLKNGELLSAAEASGIEVFVTGDKALLLPTECFSAADCDCDTFCD